jgi:hypothetical protein
MLFVTGTLDGTIDGNMLSIATGTLDGTIEGTVLPESNAGHNPLGGPMTMDCSSNGHIFWEIYQKVVAAKTIRMQFTQQLTKLIHPMVLPSIKTGYTSHSLVYRMTEDMLRSSPAALKPFKVT